MRKFWKLRRWLAAGTLAVTLTLGAAQGAQAWTINGSEQPQIPFWYTLKEAVCAYLFNAQGCDDVAF